MEEKICKYLIVYIDGDNDVYNEIVQWDGISEENINNFENSHYMCYITNIIQLNK